MLSTPRALTLLGLLWAAPLLATPLPVCNESVHTPLPNGSEGYTCQSDGWNMFYSAGSSRSTQEGETIGWDLDYGLPFVLSAPTQVYFWAEASGGSTLGSGKNGGSGVVDFIDVDALSGKSTLYSASGGAFNFSPPPLQTILPAGRYLIGASLSNSIIHGFSDDAYMGFTFNLQLTPIQAPVPEPATWALMSTGLVGLVGWRLRRRA